MLGGPNSFGAGGWANTELEAAMPVDFQIKNAKIQAVGALVLMMHASEMAAGNHWQKVVAREAIKSLGPMDYCGLIHWDNFGQDSWLWGGKQGLVRISGQRKQMLARLDRMTPGDMPDFEPAMKMALAAFNSVPASIKHMIVISDGDPTAPFPATVNSVQAGGHQDHDRGRRHARAGGQHAAAVAGHGHRWTVLRGHRSRSPPQDLSA